MQPQEKHRNDIINFVPSGGSRSNLEDSENIQDDLTAAELREKCPCPDLSNCQLEETDNAISDDSTVSCGAGPTFVEEVSATESFPSIFLK